MTEKENTDEKSVEYRISSIQNKIDDDEKK